MAPEFTAKEIGHRIKSRMPSGLQTGLGVTFLAESVAKEMELLHLKVMALLEAYAVLEYRIKFIEDKDMKE